VALGAHRGINSVVKRFTGKGASSRPLSCRIFRIFGARNSHNLSKSSCAKDG